MRGDIDIELAFVPVEFAPCIGRAGGRDAHKREYTFCSPSREYGCHRRC
jgi:hypothetical protein